MIAVTPYISTTLTYVDDKQSSSIHYKDYYKSSDFLNSNNATINFKDLLNDVTIIKALLQQEYETNKKNIEDRITKICYSFIHNGGKYVGIVGLSEFFNICSELIYLPFKDVMVQYSQSNEEILFDMLFSKGIEISIAKYLNSLDGDNVMFSVRAGGEIYAINSKNLYELKDELLEMLLQKD